VRADRILNFGKNPTIPLDGIRDFRLTICDFGFDKITSAALTDCASSCQHVPLDGIRDFRLTICDFGFDKITSAALTDCVSHYQHVPLGGIKTNPCEELCPEANSAYESDNPAGRD
jgi:hypothetical protein